MIHKTRQCQIEAVSRYNKKNTQTLNVRLNNKTDADIIREMESHSSKAGYIKELIRKDIERKIKESSDSSVNKMSYSFRTILDEIKALS